MIEEKQWWFYLTKIVFEMLKKYVYNKMMKKIKRGQIRTLVFGVIVGTI